MSKNYDYVLFDLDGTITDSKPGIIRCIKLAFDQKGISYTNEILDKMIGPPFRVSMKEFFGLDGEIVEELIRIYRAEYETRGWMECSIYDGVVELFETLKREGKHLAVATSKPLKFTNKMIDGLDLRKYFDFVGGATSDSSGESKEDVVRLVLNNLDIKDVSKAVMVGDRLYDIVGAHACGVDCIAELWGYGDREEFVNWNADYICETPQDVADIILK